MGKTSRPRLMVIVRYDGIIGGITIIKPGLGNCVHERHSPSGHIGRIAAAKYLAGIGK